MLNYCLYRLGQFLAMRLPLGSAYRLAVTFSDLHYLFADKDRRYVKENLEAIFPEKSRKEIMEIRLRMFRNFAKYLVDFFRFSLIDAEYFRRNIKTENMHYFEEALSKGKGVIVLTAHLGNWELGGVAMAFAGYPCWAVALPHRSKKVNEFFNLQRESKGLKVIPLGRAVRTCLNLLQENKLIALVGDRDFTEKGILTNFFDKPTLLPEGPAAFALRTGAPILPGFMLRNKDESFTLRMEKPLYFSPSRENDKDLLQVINQYKVVMEEYIRNYPDQWFMFKRFWAE